NLGIAPRLLAVDLLELRSEVLRLAAREQQRGALGATIAGPGAVVASDRAVEVLELDEVQRVLAEHQRIDLVPATVSVAELEVGPDPVRGMLGDPLAEVLEALALMVELGGGHLDPPVVDQRLLLLQQCGRRTGSSY